MFFRYLLILLSATLLGTTSIAAQKVIDPAAVEALKKLQQLDQRLHDIGHRLTTGNRSFCKEDSFRSGLLLHDIDQYGDKEAAKAAHGFATPIAVNAVTGINTHSVRSGDGLISINGIALSEVSLDTPELASEEPQYRRLAAVNSLLEQQLEMRSKFRNNDLLVALMRDNVEVKAHIFPIGACFSRFQIRSDKDLKASADGRMVTITSALAKYVKSDDELAAIAAHELAHNLLKHKERLNTQKVNRGFFGQFGKSAGRIKATEIEADRLSVWLMVNAGYDPQATIQFWTRYGKEHGKGIFSASTHYRWKKRVKLFEEELEKIAAMQPIREKYAPPLLAAVQ